MVQDQLEVMTSSGMEIMPAERADEIIHQSEAAKAKIFLVTGETECFQFIAKIDYQEDYQLVSNHVKVMNQKICRGEYIDFSKLLPKDHILSEEDKRLELLVKQGCTFCNPVSEMVMINGYNYWEPRFFCIYSTHESTSTDPWSL